MALATFTMNGPKGPFPVKGTRPSGSFLCVHPTPEVKRGTDRSWTVSHVATGLAAIRLPSRPVALAAMAAMRPADASLWDFTDAAAARDPKFSELMKGVYRQFVPGYAAREREDEEAAPMKGTGKNLHTGAEHAFEVSVGEIRGIVISDENATCSGPCACTGLEPDGTCVYGWPSMPRALGII